MDHMNGLIFQKSKTKKKKNVIKESKIEMPFKRKENEDAWIKCV